MIENLPHDSFDSCAGRVEPRFPRPVDRAMPMIQPSRTRRLATFVSIFLTAYATAQTALRKFQQAVLRGDGAAGRAAPKRLEQTLLPEPLEVARKHRDGRRAPLSRILSVPPGEKFLRDTVLTK